MWSWECLCDLCLYPGDEFIVACEDGLSGGQGRISLGLKEVTAVEASVGWVVCTVSILVEGTALSCSGMEGCRPTFSGEQVGPDVVLGIWPHGCFAVAQSPGDLGVFVSDGVVIEACQGSVSFCDGCSEPLESDQVPLIGEVVWTGGEAGSTEDGGVLLSLCSATP